MMKKIPQTAKSVTVNTFQLLKKIWFMAAVPRLLWNPAILYGYARLSDASLYLMPNNIHINIINEGFNRPGAVGKSWFNMIVWSEL